MWTIIIFNNFKNYNLYFKIAKDRLNKYRF